MRRRFPDSVCTQHPTADVSQPSYVITCIFRVRSFNVVENGSRSYGHGAVRAAWLQRFTIPLFQPPSSLQGARLSLASPSSLEAFHFRSGL